jgi:hypothetical protein
MILWNGSEKNKEDKTKECDNQHSIIVDISKCINVFIYNNMAHDSTLHIRHTRENDGYDTTHQTKNPFEAPTHCT